MQLIFILLETGGAVLLLEGIHVRDSSSKRAVYQHGTAVRITAEGNRLPESCAFKGCSTSVWQKLAHILWSAGFTMGSLYTEAAQTNDYEHTKLDNTSIYFLFRILTHKSQVISFRYNSL